MDRAIRRQFAYNSWANQRVAASFRTITKTPDRSRVLFAHLLNAERLWLCRILGEAGPLPWLERTQAECEQLVEENERAYSRFLESDGAVDEQRLIDYQNTEGVSFQTPLRDILQHVLLHGAYHRGQIATAVKAEGGTPASTDFLVYVRAVGPDSLF